MVVPSVEDNRAKATQLCGHRGIRSSFGFIRVADRTHLVNWILKICWEHASSTSTFLLVGLCLDREIEQSSRYTAPEFVAHSFSIDSMLAIHHITVIDAQLIFTNFVEMVPALDSVQ